MSFGARSSIAGPPQSMTCLPLADACWLIFDADATATSDPTAISGPPICEAKAGGGNAESDGTITRLGRGADQDML